jgi:hypothetical protein
MATKQPVSPRIKRIGPMLDFVGPGKGKTRDLKRLRRRNHAAADRLVERARKDRSELQQKVELGRLTPTAAKKLVDAQGLEPFERAPPTSNMKLDPTSDHVHTWTPAMAAAWICTRSPYAVRGVWPEYLFGALRWIPREDAPRGYYLRRPRPSFSNFDEPAYLPREFFVASGVHQDIARQKLLTAWREARLPLFAKKQNGSAYIEVTGLNTWSLNIFADSNGDDGLFGDDGEQQYWDVRVCRSDILKLWPSPVRAHILALLTAHIGKKIAEQEVAELDHPPGSPSAHSEAVTSDAANPETPRQRGRKKGKGKEIVDAMLVDLRSGNITANGLYQMEDKTLEHRYGEPHGAKRTITREARERALTEFKSDNSRQLTSKDN